MLSTGIKAPDFTLKDKDGKEVGLSSFLGRKVVLYFYPKDNTPGCTREACAFAGAYIGFKQRNVEVIGVSSPMPTSPPSMSFPSSSCPTRSLLPFRHTMCGRRKSFTARFLWEW